MSNGKSPIDPNRLSVEQASKLLSAAAKIRISEEQIAEDLADGAPQNKDGKSVPGTWTNTSHFC